MQHLIVSFYHVGPKSSKQQSYYQDPHKAASLLKVGIQSLWYLNELISTSRQNSHIPQVM